MIASEVFGGEAAVLQVFELALRGRDDVCVEAGDLHAAGLAVDALRDELAHLGDRIPRGAAGGARVLVGLAGLERKSETLEPAQSRRLSRMRARDPRRIGNDDGIGGELLRVFLDRRFEMGAPDLLLELPEEVDVQGKVLLP